MVLNRRVLGTPPVIPSAVFLVILSNQAVALKFGLGSLGQYPRAFAWEHLGTVGRLDGSER